MKKKVMAVAVAGALAAPAMALAQSATVQIYGTIVMNYNLVNQGAGSVKGDYFNAHDSNWGLRGEEKLGGGLSAWFQCETSFDPSLGGDGVCARNSAIGFKGAFGNIFAGNWDTPFKLAHGPARIWSTSGAFGNGGLLWNESGNNVGNGAGNAGGQVVPLPNANGTSFTRRHAQMWQWHSPNWNGFQVMAGFSAAAESVEGAGGRTLLTSGVLNAKPRLWSLAATYTSGPLYIGAGYEKHKDYNPSGNVTTYVGGNDDAWLLAASYRFGSARLTGIYTQSDYDTSPTTNLKREGFGIYLDWAISGPHGLRLGWTHAGDGKGTAGGANVGSIAAPTAAGQTDSGADQLGIQYYHNFSKRTEVNFGYAMLSNDARSRNRLQTLGGRNTCQGFAAAQSISCDRDQKAWVLGVRHRF